MVHQNSRLVPTSLTNSSGTSAGSNSVVTPAMLSRQAGSPVEDRRTDTETWVRCVRSSLVCTWSADIYPNGDYMVTGAEVQTALQEAGIPNRIVVKPPDPEPPSTSHRSHSLYCVMVPGERGTGCATCATWK